MGYRHISLCCKCGNPPNRIDEVGLTDDHELVIHWWCDECKRVVYASKSLADCWQECPKEVSPAPAAAAAAEPDLLDQKLESCFDSQFLESLGISSE
jgi:hypothetical protein